MHVLGRSKRLLSHVSHQAYLLVPSLHAAVPFKQIDCVPHLVCKDLNLDVARALNEPLQQNALISKGSDGFSFS